jgi:hypothetical protein
VAAPPLDRLAKLTALASTRCALLRLTACLPLVGGVAALPGGEEATAQGRRHRRKRRCGNGGPCRVFVSSHTYAGNLGGLDGADAECQALAKATKLPGSYKAWLSDDTGSPSTRFVHSTGPYQLVNGTTIANNWADLTDGSLRHAINKSETGGRPPGDKLVWTRTQSDGTPNTPPDDDDCEGWTKATAPPYGSGGDPTETDFRWSARFSGDGCTNNRSLYCFQQS